jgi:serine/threonine protein kinase
MIHSSLMTELPTTFGKYFLTDKLATGGMAEIYLAKLLGPGGFEKQLVIKQIHPALSSQRAFVDLFVAEAKTLVTLSQGNIVPVYELGVVDDTYFIAMEYIDGPTLWQLTEAVFERGDAMDPAIAAFIAAEIAKGLDYAHRKGTGVIHRDLSPRNVMLTRDGDVKLVDFGIAVALGAGPDPADGGLPTGSFPYMSPEQAAGAALTGQTDLFALGVLLWEMLTGQRLFARSEPDATIAAVRDAIIPVPSSVRPTPTRLDAIVMRALDRDLDARWASAGQLSAALQRYLADETTLSGARDLATLIARVAPAVPHAAASAASDSVTHHDRSALDDSAGPSTQVVPRESARGKRRPTVREATFATHVELERVMAPIDAPIAIRAAPPPGPPAPIRPRRIWWAMATAALVASSLIVWRVTSPSHDRASISVDAAVPPAADAATVDAAAVDAAATAPPADASVVVIAVDGRDGPSRDARAATLPPDAALVTNGRLRVGADPWGEVILDGKPLGRAPNEWSVTAGAHTVVVVFPAEDPERQKRFEVVVPANGRSAVFADFTKP